MRLLLADEKLKDHFFDSIDNIVVFKQQDFQFFLEKHSVNNSYTKYTRRKIGLIHNNEFFSEKSEVVLNFPFKDCVLQGGQSSEEGEECSFEIKNGTISRTNKKRQEIFFNQILAKDEIDRLCDPKALIKATRFDKNGKNSTALLKRNENGDITDNLIIKGNNYIALHTLKTQFKGRVKLIYIDPPYNTGNDSFKYNDRFNHSTWLTFMKNRLEVARDLLADNGVIFVQCDDNEQAYLKVLMDEIFGRENFVANTIVIINRGGRDYGGIARTHEYIIAYSKTDAYELNGIIEVNKKFPMEDDIGGFEPRELRNRNILFNKENRPNLYYPFYVNVNNIDKNGLYEISLEKHDNWIEVYPLKSQGVNTVWRWGKDKAKKFLNIDIKGKAKQGGGYMIVQKYRSLTKMQRSIFDDKEFVNERGTEHIKELFGGKLFSYPKSEFLVSRIIELATNENDTILDFHLGSGTTAAVAHKMNRQYIGIEQMDYIETIAVERLKKVIEGEQGGISKAVNWQGGGDFVYCELATLNETAQNQILACEDLSQLQALFNTLTEKYFLKYNVNVKAFVDDILYSEAFAKLDLNEQKQMIAEMLDLNQLYVNYSEIADSQFAIDENDQAFSTSFYEGNK